MQMPRPGKNLLAQATPKIVKRQAAKKAVEMA
jgi:hypothetical protein